MDSGWKGRGDGFLHTTHRQKETVRLLKEDNSPSLTFNVDLLDSSGALKMLLSRFLYNGKNVKDYTKTLFEAVKNKYINSKPSEYEFKNANFPLNLNWSYTEASSGTIYSYIVVIKRMRIFYDGGAHETHEKEWFVLDVDMLSRVRLAELFNSGTEAALKKSVIQQLKTVYAPRINKSINSTLSDIGFFKDDVDVQADNFFVTPQGLGFTWFASAIAPYSYGVIEVILPYNDIKELLNARGKEIFRTVI